jgi:hypothetical protein
MQAKSNECGQRVVETEFPSARPLGKENANTASKTASKTTSSSLQQNAAKNDVNEWGRNLCASNSSFLNRTFINHEPIIANFPDRPTRPFPFTEIYNQ